MMLVLIILFDILFVLIIYWILLVFGKKMRPKKLRLMELSQDDISIIIQIDIYNKEGDAPNINLNDDRYIISRDPKWIGSLNTSVSYKGFDFYMSMYTRQGVRALSDAHKQSSDDPVRYRGFRVNYWTPENRSNDYPAPAIKGTYTDFSNSDYFVKDVSFVRISNISLGYTLPKDFIQKFRMENAKVYININNPFVFTPFDGQDPQVGTDKKSYPSVTSYQLGVNLNF